MSLRIKFFEIKKFLILLTILVFSFLGAFALNLSMSLDNHGKMSSCNLMSTESGICQMTLSDHFLRWGQMFTATINWSLTSLLLLVTAFSIGFITLFKAAEHLFLQLHQRYKVQNPMLKLFDYLLLAFSKGILHPKIYV